MTQAALGGLDDATVPTRYVFDEGHHLLEAADSAFSVRLSGREGRELRRWIVGAEGRDARAPAACSGGSATSSTAAKTASGLDRGPRRGPHPARRRLGAAGR